MSVRPPSPRSSATATSACRPKPGQTSGSSMPCAAMRSRSSSADRRGASCRAALRIARIRMGWCRDSSGSCAPRPECLADQEALRGCRSCPARFRNGPSGLTVDRDREGAANVAQTSIGQAAQPLDKNAGRNALDRVEVDSRTPGDRVVARLENDLARERPDGCRARRDEHSPESRNRRVAREDHDGAPADLRELAPPDLTPSGEGVHDAAAASRNDARSPHSSGSSSGCSS